MKLGHLDGLRVGAGAHEIRSTLEEHTERKLNAVMSLFGSNKGMRLQIGQFASCATFLRVLQAHTSTWMHLLG